MRVSRSFILAAIAAAMLAPVPASARDCSMLGIVRLYGMALGQARPHFFYTPEGTNTQFTIRVEGHTCPPENATIRYDTPPEAVALSPAATPGSDYQRVDGIFDYNIDTPDEVRSKTVEVPMIEDPVQEAAAESLMVELTGSGSPQPRIATPRVPMFIVDDDGPTRVRFVFPNIEWAEYSGTLNIPVFRAGSSTSGNVSYTITPNTGDYSSPSSGNVSFRSDGRLGTIPFTVVNDTAEEGNETFTVTLAGTPTEPPATFTITIPASDEGGQGDTVRPNAWFHHPKHRARYERTSPYADEIHLFADDNEGHRNIQSAQVALRRKLQNGNCQFWKRGAWRAGSCSNPQWIGLNDNDRIEWPGGKWLYEYNAYPSLAPSVGTRITNYTVYGRATDQSGNRSRLVRGENLNTFEVTRN